MYESIIKKIKKCLPAKIKKYTVHEPLFSKETIKGVEDCIKSTYVSTSGDYINKFIDQLDILAVLS